LQKLIRTLKRLKNAFENVEELEFKRLPADLKFYVYIIISAYTSDLEGNKK
jgi:hypothetical protein